MLSVIWRDQADQAVYDEARVRRLFNRQIPDKYPLAIAFAQTEQDVLDAVKLAIERQCCISICAGGQSWPVWSVREDAIMLDLGGYEEIDLDEATGIVRVSPSTTGYNLNEHLSAKGRIFSVGHCPDVGVGGALLCGGMGWNCNNWGFACEHIVAIDVVTAQGELIRADEVQNADLFWAAKGAGPAFPGIITRFHVQTRPAPVHMLSSGYVYLINRYEEAFRWIVKVSPPFMLVVDTLRTDRKVIQIADSFESSMEAVAVGSYAGTDGLCITIALLATGDDEQALRADLQRIEDSHPAGTVTHWFCEQTNLRQEFHTKAKAYPAAHRYAVDCTFLRNDSDVVETLKHAFTSVPTKTSLVLWNTMVPRSRSPLPDMALSVQSDHYFAMYGVCELKDDFDLCNSWVHREMLDISKHEVGTYVGEFDPRARRSNIWSDEACNRLMKIKQDRDPLGRFCGYPGLEHVAGLANQDQNEDHRGLLSRLYRFISGT